LGASNYIGNGGKTGPYEPALSGPYYQNSRTKITAIGDGTSNTIAFGETLAGKYSARDFRLSWMGAGSMPSKYGIPSDPNARWWTWSSKHSGVVMFGFCDGSVRGFRKGIEYSATPTPQLNAFYYAAGVADGQVNDYSFLGN
jgi:prepilin-type processing-associated H-X9-DG protein